jgi:hypothetical protein
MKTYQMKLGDGGCVLSERVEWKMMEKGLRMRIAAGRREMNLLSHGQFVSYVLGTVLGALPTADIVQGIE